MELEREIEADNNLLRDNFNEEIGSGSALPVGDQDLAPVSRFDSCNSDYNEGPGNDSLNGNNINTRKRVSVDAFGRPLQYVDCENQQQQPARPTNSNLHSTHAENTESYQEDLDLERERSSSTNRAQSHEPDLLN